MQVSIIIPTYQHCDDLLVPCLESIIKYTTLNDIEILAVANGCTDNTAEYVKSLGDPFKLIWIEEAAGYTRAVNEGIKQAEGDFLILLNNDTVLLEQPKDLWLKMLLDPFEDPKMGLTGPMKVYSPEAEEDFLIFFCVAIRKILFNELGLLNEIYNPGFGEDTEFSILASRAGWKVIQVPNTNTSYAQPNFMVGGFPIWHKGEGTFTGMTGGDELLARNRETLKKRLRIPKKPLKLNLGCGDLKFPDYINIDLYNKNADLQLDVRDLSQFKDNSVDEILALHVFEHLSPYEVSNVLKEWHRVLKPAGKLALELPDILEICKHFESSNKDEKYRLLNCIYGTTFPDHPHLFGWYDEILFDHLAGAGFVDLRKLEVEQKHHWGYNMRIEAHKPPTVIEQSETLSLKTNNKPKIYDCFPFFNELDLLEIRLNEMHKVADYFVIVESTKTHSGKPKPLYFAENKDRFSKFLTQIVHIIVEDGEDTPLTKAHLQKDVILRKMLNAGDAWTRERFQRDSMMKGLINANDHDIIIVSDADEIPRASTVAQYDISQSIRSLSMNFYYYYLNYRETSWTETKILPYKLLKELGPCLTRYTPCDKIDDGGWHFSFLGNSHSIIQKLESYAHQEYNIDKFKDPKHIEEAIKNGSDLFDRDYKYKLVPIDETYPQFIIDNKDQLKQKGLIL